jgi:16S rRNA (guanine966-N2)-methyltransferase
VGLEALSRGAATAVLVESNARAARVIRENIVQLGLPGATLVTAPVQRFLAGRPAGSVGSAGFAGSAGFVGSADRAAPPFDVVFADPPYVVPVDKTLELLRNGRWWLAPDALIVVERATRSGDLSWPEGYVPGKARRYGEATFWYGRLASQDPSQHHRPDQHHPSE